jgi:adenine-specific DNA-methyltransferase
MSKTPAAKKNVVTLTHEEASRKNIPTAEYQSVMRTDEQSPIRVAYERRNRDLDPQLVWRGKDVQEWSDLVVPAPPLYIQEKVHPKVLIDDLKRRTESGTDKSLPQFDLFADFNGLPSEDAKTEFYQHDAHWSNRLILGDSLQVMASLAEREGLRGKVQCIFFDPPYGIKFNSNFQWSTTSRDVKDGNLDHITREPEQVKAFRDTWRDGIHSYLTYLRDRLTVARDLLTDSGSIFVQIGDENVHRVKSLMEEVFGEEHFVSLIAFTKGATGLGSSDRLPARLDYIVWFSRKPESHKFHPLFTLRSSKEIDPNFNWLRLADGQMRRLNENEKSGKQDIPEDARVFGDVSLTKPGPGRKFEISFKGKTFDSGKRWWGMTPESLGRALKSGRVEQFGNALRQIRFQDESSAVALGNLWEGFLGQNDPVYVVQTNTEIVRRCILLTTDPGDLVLDPTCGSGTTAYVAENWGRRWITIDTSRVALALARARIMGARYPYFLLSDSREGQMKEGQLMGLIPSEAPTHGKLRQGFVYQRVPHITLKSIAANSEVDIIAEEFDLVQEPIRLELNNALKKTWASWEIPRDPESGWSASVKELHSSWWEHQASRLKKLESSIAAKADFEMLYDRPFDDPKRVRVAGPFTVESLSPHRVLAVDENSEFIDPPAETEGDARDARNFVNVILEALKAAGVQQAHREDKLIFSSITPWPGDRVCAEARYIDADGIEKRAAILIGPEFGTLSRPDLVLAAREAGDAAFDILVTCAFNYDAHSSEFTKLGKIPVLKARMNADLHMANELKNTGKGNLFVIFGEPDIDLLPAGANSYRVKVNGVDIFDPGTGEVRSDGADGIACWFLDTDYNEESFFVRHAYFLGANDPYKSLKTTLKAEVSEEAWETLHRDTSRPFDAPASGRIAVKVINHLGDEVMKVFRVN